MQPRLQIEQSFTAFVNKYKVFLASNGSVEDSFISLAQQKRLAFKEKVIFYSDEQKANELFSFRAEKVVDVHGRYIVEDPEGKTIGMFRKEFKKSLFISNWVLMNATGDEVMRITENSVAIALLRRFISFVPFIGELLDIFINFFRYHFVFTDSETGQQVGMYKKTTLLRDHYQLLMTDDGWKKMDWRVYAAMGVALDALQSR
jgi:hypothetical protein